MNEKNYTLSQHVNTLGTSVHISGTSSSYLILISLFHSDHGTSPDLPSTTTQFSAKHYFRQVQRSADLRVCSKSGRVIPRVSLKTRIFMITARDIWDVTTTEVAKDALKRNESGGKKKKIAFLSFCIQNYKEMYFTCIRASAHITYS